MVKRPHAGWRSINMIRGLRQSEYKLVGWNWMTGTGSGFASIRGHESPHTSYPTRRRARSSFMMDITEIQVRTGSMPSKRAHASLTAYWLSSMSFAPYAMCSMTLGLATCRGLNTISSAYI